MAKKIKKCKFYKNKKVTRIDDVDVNKRIWHMAQRIYLNTLLDTMKMVLLDHFVQDFHKWLAMPKFDENATMYFRANNKQPLKIYNKIWEKVES